MLKLCHKVAPPISNKITHELWFFAILFILFDFISVSIPLYSDVGKRGKRTTCGPSHCFSVLFRIKYTLLAGFTEDTCYKTNVYTTNTSLKFWRAPLKTSKESRPIFAFISFWSGWIMYLIITLKLVLPNLTHFVFHKSLHLSWTGHVKQAGEDPNTDSWRWKWTQKYNFIN